MASCTRSLFLPSHVGSPRQENVASANAGWTHQSNAFSTRLRAGGDGKEQEPWKIGKYYTKKLERRTNELGEIIQSPETIAEPIGWNQNAKLQLAVEVVARDSGLPVEELKCRVRQLQTLLPDLSDRQLSTAQRVELALDVDSVALRLIRLRDLLPGVNVSELVTKRPSLLTDEISEVESSVNKAQELLKETGGVESFERFVESQPSILNVKLLEATLGELGRLFKGKKVARLLEKSPHWLWTLQSLQGQSRGDRDEGYVKSMHVKKEENN